MAYFYNSLGLRFNEMKEVYVYGEWEAIYNQSVVEGIVKSWTAKISAKCSLL